VYPEPSYPTVTTAPVDEYLPRTLFGTSPLGFGPLYHLGLSKDDRGEGDHIRLSADVLDSSSLPPSGMGRKARLK
jgi:hypothetical protein